MPAFINNDGIKYHLDGKYHDKLNLFSVDFSTTYTECRFPAEKRRQLLLTLTKTELSDLIDALLDLSESAG